MAAYKISSLTIKNFKCFDHIVFDFSSNSLVVFDGPNGYGKTTAFEALEVLLTKTPRKLAKIKLDKRYKYKNSPIHKAENLPIEIAAVFESEAEQILNIKRVIPAADLRQSKKNNIGLIFNDSVLYIDNVQSSEQALEEALEFKNLDNLFNVLNYVEQDENTYFLKEDPKERYKALISLLGGSEERILYDKTIEFCRKTSEKVHQLNLAINAINTQNNETLKDDGQQVQYKALLPGLSPALPWDSQLITNTNLDLHNSYLVEIKKVENLFEMKTAVQNVLAIKKLNDIINNNALLQSFVENFWSIQNFAVLEEEDKKRKENDNQISGYISLITLIDNKRYSEILLNKHLFDLEEKTEKPAVDFNLLRTQLTLTISLIESLSVQNQILSDLKDKREGLNKVIEAHKSVLELKDGECYTCGYNWQTTEQLKQQIEETEVKIFSSYIRENDRLESMKLALENDFLKVIKSFIENQAEKLTKENGLLISPSQFQNLKNSFSALNSQSAELAALFSAEELKEVMSYINMRTIENLENAVLKLVELISRKRPEIDSSINIDQVINDFNLYFSGKIGELNVLESEDLKNKRLYVQHQYYNAINQTLQGLVQRKEKLEHIYDEINGIGLKIDQKIRQYTKSIVEKISIPFYIFTGKILQNHTLGSGLLLILDIDKENSQIYIRPKQRDQEVTYTLSSGQLAATVISLMLVLNKVFNNSKLGTIFIDDPLQTLDEINSHSLVELLKYNFSDQQIILSTHEDRYSQFLQYKFNKFNLSNKSLRLKDLT